MIIYVVTSNRSGCIKAFENYEVAKQFAADYWDRTSGRWHKELFTWHDDMRIEDIEIVPEVESIYQTTLDFG